MTNYWHLCQNCLGADCQHLLQIGVGNPRYDMPYSIVLQFLCQSRFFNLSIFDVVARSHFAR